MTPYPYNLFHLLRTHIEQTDDVLGGVSQLPFFRNHAPELTPCDYEALAKRLVTGWGSEYALRATSEFGDEAFMRDALHWTLPQVYYAIAQVQAAFLYTTGVRSNNRQLVLRETGRLVVKNAYPRPVAFYAAGGYGDFGIHRLPLQGYKVGKTDAFYPEVQTQTSIADCLKIARKEKSIMVRAEVQGNPNTAIRNPQTGAVLKAWKSAHWQQITWRLGYTTVFDLLAGLKDAKPELPADLNAGQFHADAVYVVNYLNTIHESYVAKAMGLGAYTTFVNELPDHLQNGFVAERLAAISQLLQPITA